MVGRKQTYSAKSQADLILAGGLICLPLHYMQKFRLYIDQKVFIQKQTN